MLLITKQYNLDIIQLAVMRMNVKTSNYNSISCIIKNNYHTNAGLLTVNNLLLSTNAHIGLRISCGIKCPY